MNGLKSFAEESFLGASSASAACLFSNPFDVIKTRFQLQGELKKRGKYHVVYRNVFHAAYTIAKNESLFSLQKGLVPAMWYQIVMNGLRFGTFQKIENNGLLKNKDGETSLIKTMAAASFAGSVGSCIGSPFYMVKTQLQSKAAEAIAVGHQHEHSKMTDAFKTIYKKNGILGIYQSSSAAMIRTTVGSCFQLTSYSHSKKLFEKYGIVEKNGWVSSILSSISGGIGVCIFMTPFDLTLTRLYNQPVDPKTGKGLFYRNLFDTFYKTFKHEGFFGFYKGLSSMALRQMPHSILNLFFFQELRKLYYK